MGKIRVHIDVKGIVQGVGFRPFVHKLVLEHALAGWVRNNSSGAELELEGAKDEIDQFLLRMKEEKPKLALIESIETRILDQLQYDVGFQIIKSDQFEKMNTLISPDVCTCDDCLRELFDPDDRRYRYPFINCTNCGPRFTIIKAIPYDRDKTTMDHFPMCDECREEYHTITNRRYHAQPDCCEVCGPQIYMMDHEGRKMNGDAITLAQNYLEENKIIAVKGLGGFHLACRMDEPELARELRARKHRDEKPFAVMCADLEEVRKICIVSEAEERLLINDARPIVLLEKKEKNSYSHISENHRIGVMLPYTPIHFLVLSGNVKCMIMTSANLSDCPIMYKNEEALKCLNGIADGYLMHDREIYVRCDDSLAWVVDREAYFSRRSRGYVPMPIRVEGSSKNILACGAEQKATFGLSKNGYLFPSQHIGDLKNLETYENYEEQIAHFETLFEVKPEMIVCDLHPDYMSTTYAQSRAEKEHLTLVRVQHHHAHMASCMADNHLEKPCIGIIWDGTGFGMDNTAWGGEFLIGDYKNFSRMGSLRKMYLAGGDKATKEIWRIGCALALDADCSWEFPEDKKNLVKRMIEGRVNSFATSSIGRLFDGVSALLGIKEKVTYEGQGAILLEAAANETKRRYPYEIQEKEVLEFDYRPMIRSILKDVSSGVPVEECAAAFMNTLVDMAVSMCCRIKKRTGLGSVVMSGGSFQNIYMLERLVAQLSSEGFEVFHHRRVAANDEGLSLGQLMIAEKGGSQYVPCSTFEIN